MFTYTELLELQDTIIQVCEKHNVDLQRENISYYEIWHTVCSSLPTETLHKIRSVMEDEDSLLLGIMKDVLLTEINSRGQ